MVKEDREELVKKRVKVLLITFAINLAVSSSKIATGILTGLLNIAADGWHSLGDSASNVVAMLGTWLGERSPNKEFPYGYFKAEAFATLAISGLMLIHCFLILGGVYERLTNPAQISIGTIPFIVLIATMLINILTYRYENKKGEELKSGILKADAAETKSDVYVSLTILLGITFMKFGNNIIEWKLWYLADPVISLVIAYLIIRLCIENAVKAIKILNDASVIPADEVEKFVLSIEGVKFCHAVKSRGRPDAFFLDLHIGVPPKMSVEEAHNNISHKVKLALKEKYYPNLLVANVQIEPDTEEARSRTKSVFKDKEH